jgi:hypothetical protein
MSLVRLLELVFEHRGKIAAEDAMNIDRIWS